MEPTEFLIIVGFIITTIVVIKFDNAKAVAGGIILFVLFFLLGWGLI